MMSDSPSKQAYFEKLNYDLALASFDSAKHLKEREKQYVDAQIQTPNGIMVIRETEEGWWKESYDFKNDKQIQKLKDDPTVVIGFVTGFRFPLTGGWYED